MVTEEEVAESDEREIDVGGDDDEIDFEALVRRTSRETADDSPPRGKKSKKKAARAAPADDEESDDYDMTDRHREGDDEEDEEDRRGAKRKAPKKGAKKAAREDDDEAGEDDDEQEADEAAADEEDREPLSVEEYRKRHRQTTQAMKEERKKRREAEDRIEAERANAAAVSRNFETLMQRLPQMLGQGQQPGAGEQKKPINLDALLEENPKGAIKAIMQRMLDDDEQRQRTAQEQREREERQAAFQQGAKTVIAKTQRYEARFKEDVAPDYDDAVAHVRQTLIRLQMTGGASQAEAEEAVFLNLINGAAIAMKNGEDPAQRLYELAPQLGYVKKRRPREDDDLDDADDEDEDEGETLRAKNRDGKRKLDMRRDGMKAARSLNSSGSKGGGGLSLKRMLDLAETDPAKFDANLEVFERRLRGKG